MTNQNGSFSSNWIQQQVLSILRDHPSAKLIVTTQDGLKNQFLTQNSDVILLLVETDGVWSVILISEMVGFCLLFYYLFPLLFT